MEVIREYMDRRIIKEPDESWIIENLKGDQFIYRENPGIDPAQLRADELAFESRIETEGVWGYLVQRWNPSVGVGWETKDSVWGLVGNDWEGSGYDKDMFAQLKIPPCPHCG